MVLGLFEDDQKPRYNIPELTKPTLEATENLYRTGLNSTPESEQQNLSTNVNQTPQNTSFVKEQGRGLGMLVDDATSQAISNRIRQRFDSDLNKMQRQAKLAAPSMVSNKLNMASQALMQKQKYDYDVYARKMKQFQDEQNARNGVISSVLGVAGAVGGALLGGPAGAVAGGSIGYGLGGTVAKG